MFIAMDNQKLGGTLRIQLAEVPSRLAACHSQCVSKWLYELILPHVPQQCATTITKLRVLNIWKASLLHDWASEVSPEIEVI